MVVPALTALTDPALFLLRLLVGLLFFSSGWSHVTRPAERAESLGMSPRTTLALGVVELIGTISVIAGLWAQAGAVLLAGVMAGAIYKKIFVWKVGFWGEEAQGWYYDLLYLTCNLVILATGGGSWAIT